MAEKLSILLAQTNPIVGNIEYNRDLIVDTIEKNKNADLIVFFMLVKAGLIMSIFMHLYWERWAIVNVLLWPMTAIGVFIAIMAAESYYTFFSRMFYFVVGS